MRIVTARQLLCLLVATAATAVSVVASADSLAAGNPAALPVTSQILLGKQLYREFCGQCHALAQALSAGFGSAHGLGPNGGPSFNDLRVSYALSLDAVAEPTGGHEIVRTRISMKQLAEVANYIARMTHDNPILATATDG
jgi:mono/diheme cytochrome c family protein